MFACGNMAGFDNDPAKNNAALVPTLNSRLAWKHHPPQTNKGRTGRPSSSSGVGAGELGSKVQGFSCTLQFLLMQGTLFPSWFSVYRLRSAVTPFMFSGLGFRA